jgi:hypothetical protein
MITLLGVTFLSLKVLSAEPTLYSTQIDKELTVHRITILPFTDNASGIYSRYTEEAIDQQVRKSHRFDRVAPKETAALSLGDLEHNTELVKKQATTNDVQALIAGHVNKTAQSLDVTLDLFMGFDGLLYAQETLSLPENTGTSILEKKVVDLYEKLLTKMPYKGLVLSREGNRVTVDLGSQDGLRDNALISVAAITGIKRHPKYKFVVNVEKENIGKIRIIKVEDTLSFGVVVQERDRNAITTGSKLVDLDYITYPDPADKNNPSNIEDQISFGKNPREWTPKKKPGLGKIGLALGLGSLQDAMATQNEGSMSSAISIYPQLNLTGELWLTEKWFVEGRIEEGISTIKNPLATSSPGSLNVNNSHYSLDGGYKFLIDDDFYGPQINVHLGMGKYSFFVDSSTQTTFTSVSYYGLYFGLGGSLPIDAGHTYFIDLKLDHYFSPGFTESPVSSGSNTDNSATEFLVGASHKLTEFLWLTAHLDFEFYSTNFTGLGSRTYLNQPDQGLNSSQNLFTLLVGAEYMF